MQILLDTRVVLWALVDDPELSVEARALLNGRSQRSLVSAISIWEISIKHALRRSDMPLSGREAVGYCRAAGYRWLDIRPEHAAEVEALPPIHAAPLTVC